jgi:putative nucleotidyltransferase with HDIG domain
MKIPSKPGCFHLMCQMQMLDHIAAHSLMVSRVALLLSDHLLQQNLSIDRDLVATAAILHDITKPRSLSTGENHAETGEVLLRDLGFPAVGRIVGQHVVLDDYPASHPPTEAAIVNYADKRVLNDRIVSLAERMEYILDRYGRTPEREQKLRWLWNKTIDLERKLFTFIPFQPDGLFAHIDMHRFESDYTAYLRHKANGGQAKASAK